MNDDLKYFTDGEAYERMMGRWSRLVGEKFLDWLAAPKVQNWLDIGCGNGAFTETLIAKCSPAEVDAIDPSEAQLTFARKRIAANNVRFHVGDAQSLPFKSNTFDAATMALVISFVPDAAKAVSEMARVVRPGGLVATYMWDGDAEDSIPLAPIRRASRELGFGMRGALPGGYASTQAGMQELWQKAGLQAVETRRIDIEVTFADFEDFWQSCTAHSSPIIHHLKSQSPEAIERARKWLDQHLPRDASGCIRYGAYANAVKGRV